jgi:predicted O-methyltransferase YrrM
MKRYTPRKLAEFAVFFGACQKISELAPLISLLQRRKLRTVVEIGTARGGTFWLWCQLAQHNATIVSVDLPGGDFGGGYSPKDAKKFKTYGKSRQSLYFLRRDSHDPATVDSVIRRLNGLDIDFLFIDGDHRYSGVKRDFKLYSPLVRDRGLIAFHDVLPHTKVKKCNVDRFWREVRRDYSHWEFTERKDDRGWGQWGGIGVISYQSGDR